MFSFAHVDTDFDILFEKLTAQIGGLDLKSTLCLWGWKFLAKPVLFFNVFKKW